MRVAKFAFVSLKQRALQLIEVSEISVVSMGIRSDTPKDKGFIE